MNEREVLKLALEALEYPLNQSHENFNVDVAELISHRAITAIKEALAQPEHEPVAWAIGGHIESDYVFVEETPLYTTPPQRTWVGLTDEQKLSLEIQGGKADVMLAELVEQWLKEKNT